MLNYTIEMVSYTPSKIIEIQRGNDLEENSVKELMGSDFEEFIDSDRYETTVKRSLHILIFEIIFEDPWKVTVNQTDVLKILFCEQKFPAELFLSTDSEGCLELL
jgi:hypothetical protein